MSAIALDIPRRRPWSWISQVVLGLIMAMGLFVSKTKSPGAGESVWSCDDNHAAASTSQANVQTAVNAAISHGSANECVDIPAGSSTWASQVSGTSTGINLWIRGAGDLEVQGGDDATEITDGISGNTPVFSVSSNSGKLRVSGVTFTTTQAVANVKHSGIVTFGGNTTEMRFDHNTINASNTSHKLMALNGLVEGVIDNNQFYSHTNDLNWLHVVNGSTSGSGDNGDTRWDDDTGFGTADFLFIESNHFEGVLDSDPSNDRPNHVATDCHTGGKYVFRNNTGINFNIGQTHPTGHASNDRACRAHEIYRNTITATFNPATQAPLNAFEYNNGGTAVVWGNDLGTSLFTTFFYFNNCRSLDGEFCGYNDPFGGWETCGESSTWDGNTGSGGYPCVDQPGRGKGDLLNGDFPSKTNQAIGGANWPRQGLEPVYIFLNTGTRNSSWGGGAVLDVRASTTIVQNRDFYYTQAGFDGTVGVGTGTRASRPGTCTTGVAYWSTDQGGDWDSTNGTANDGTLDKCTATNTWTNGFYTPYTFPHPLTL